MTTKPTKFVVLDLETTGLETVYPGIAQPIEIAAIAYDPDADVPPYGRMLSFVPNHEPREMVGHADFGALAVNRYFERRLFDTMLSPHDSAESIAQLVDMLDGATLVGANPAYDAAILWPWLKLRTDLDRAPWKFRLFDVEAATMIAHNLDRIPSLKQCAELWDVAPSVDGKQAHTALGDAMVTADVFHAIRLWQRDPTGELADLCTLDGNRVRL